MIVPYSLFTNFMEWFLANISKITERSVMQLCTKHLYGHFADRHTHTHTHRRTDGRDRFYYLDRVADTGGKNLSINSEPTVIVAYFHKIIVVSCKMRFFNCCKLHPSLSPRLPPIHHIYSIQY